MRGGGGVHGVAPGISEKLLNFEEKNNNFVFVTPGELKGSLKIFSQFDSAVWPAIHIYIYR